MEHSEHTATDASNPASTPSDQTWPLWLRDSESAARWIKLQWMMGEEASPPSLKSMTWMRGLLAHGSGFTEQVLAKSKHNDWGHTGTRLLNGSYYRLWRGHKTGKVYVSLIGKRERTNPAGSPSTLALRLAPQMSYGLSPFGKQGKVADRVYKIDVPWGTVPATHSQS